MCLESALYVSLPTQTKADRTGQCTWINVARGNQINLFLFIYFVVVHLNGAKSAMGTKSCTIDRACFKALCDIGDDSATSSCTARIRDIKKKLDEPYIYICN